MGLFAHIGSTGKKDQKTEIKKQERPTVWGV
jgi:hypothetical protein